VCSGLQKRHRTSQALRAEGIGRVLAERILGGGHTLNTLRRRRTEVYSGARTAKKVRKNRGTGTPIRTLCLQMQIKAKGCVGGGLFGSHHIG